MKKIAISLLFLSIIILLFIFVNSNYASNFLKILSGNIKLENKEIIKKYLLPYRFIKEQNNIISKLKKNNEKLRIDRQQKSDELRIFEEENIRLKKFFTYAELLNKELRYKNGPLRFTKIKEFEIIGSGLSIERYTSNEGLYTGIYIGFPGSAYLETNNDNIFIITARGHLAYSNLNTLNEFNYIENNISSFININQYKKNRWFSIKDLHIHNDKIFVAYSEEFSKDCWNTSLLYADLKINKINFKKLFSAPNCIHSLNVNEEIKNEDFWEDLIKKKLIKNKDLQFHGAQSGGRVISLNNEEILFTIGDYRQRYLAQDNDSLNGKIIKINLNSNDYTIISKGHRNQQGLEYDINNDIILSTEHGPQGGDEINLIIQGKVLKNYGWPIASYGEHYGGKESPNNIDLYKKYPLLKSHKDNGFEEPLLNFTPSIGISQIVNIGKNKYSFASLKDKSLYFFELSDKKIKNLIRHEIGERIRDLDFHDNKLYLFMESSATIGILDTSKLY